MFVIAFALAASATGVLSGVGLGPLSKNGMTDTSSKAFYLTVSNPARRAKHFVVSALPSDDMVQASAFNPKRILIFPVQPLISGERGRRVMIVVQDLEPGEELNFRVCAEEKVDETPIIHPRVCSKLSARRIAFNR